MKLRELLQQLKSTQESINSSEAFICGGTPRDRYLKHLENISDLDCTTGDKSVQYLANEFGSALAKKYNVTLRNHDDGHSTVYIGSFKMDFSSNFNVPGIDQILAKMGINQPTEMQKEMYSRDFTCNSLLLSLDLKNVLDPTKQGFKDIDRRVIRTCLSPEVTLTTNRNRVIRAVYLSSKLDFDIDQPIIDYVAAHPESVKISTDRVMAEKLNEAFNRDPERAAYNISKMNLWDQIPITEVVQPYYMKAVNQPTKVAYFQGGGGVNEPTPKKKKYKSDPALVVQPRFKEPLYRNYDLYDVPGEHGPGPGWHSMQNFKSVQDFLKARRKKLKDKYKADDSWQLDSGERTKKNPNKEARISLLSKLVKTAIDFPLDEYIEPGLAAPEGAFEENDNPVGSANQIGGYLDEYLPENDFEEKPPTTLDFGRDYAGPEILDEETLDKFTEKYLSPSPTHGLFGLPDGVDLPEEDLGVPNEINPDYGTLGPESLMYEDKWNI